MKKKHWYLTTAMATSMVMLAACGGNNNDVDADTQTNDNENDANEQETVQIQFMHTSVQQERAAVIDGLVEEFEDQYPHIEVEQVVVEEENLNTNIITLASAGELPEVIETGQDYARVMDTDELIDREAVMNVLEDVGMDGYYDGALNLLRTEEGEHYRAVPISGWVQGIWYNREMLESGGFDHPETWDDILEVAEYFHNPDDNQYGIALPTVESNFSEQSFSQFALSNNANILDSDGELTVNTPEMLEALEYYQQLSELTMRGSNDTTEVRDAFMNGSAPMAVYSTYILPTVFNDGDPENVGYAVPSQEQEAVYGTVTSLTITSALEDAQREASEAFVAFMAQPENMTDYVLMAPGGAQPVHEGVVANEAYQSHEVVAAFGDLFTDIAESFNDIQVFGLVGDKNFVKMGDITASGAIPQMVYYTTVGEADPQEQIEEAESTLSNLLD